MSRRERLRLRFDRLRERWFADAVGACRRLGGPLRPVGSLGVVGANLVNLLWQGAANLVIPAGRARRLTGRVRHVFVLVLENRSFDHLLGHSYPEPGQAGVIDGPDPARDRNGDTSVGTGAPPVMPDDPPHEFENVRTQLCGTGGSYPHVDMSGFIDSYLTVEPRDPSLVMKGFVADQVPVITALARDFAICDRWFSSLPGPTWPNRFFWHAASSAGLDSSPSAARTASASFIDGYSFENGTIYDLLSAAGIEWSVYHGDLFPQTLAIAGMQEHLLGGRFHRLEELAGDLAREDFAPGYVFIEPDYGKVLPHPTFTGGSSQHPIDDVGGGERLIKQVYEAIRSSPHWEHSLLIVGHDEHGGFYDHVVPPRAVPPGDRTTDPTNNRNGFDFSQLGVRVPAVIVSPFIPRGTVDHIERDHTSSLATVERLFGLPSLTARDRAAADLVALLSLDQPRTDTPVTLPDPPTAATLAQPDPGDSAEAMTPAQEAFLQVALRRHLASAAPTERDGIVKRVRALRTQGDAGQYMDSVARQVTGADGPHPEATSPG